MLSRNGGGGGQSAVVFFSVYIQGQIKHIYVSSVFISMHYSIGYCSTSDLYVPFARTALIERQPLTKFPKTWHEFPNEDVKFLKNKQTFNEELKKHFLSQLNANYRCVRLFCPHCHPADGL